MRIFLGHDGYYRKLIKDFSKQASPLFTLLSKDVEFIWTPVCQTTFSTLKEKGTYAPILQGPNWEFPFHIYTIKFWVFYLNRRRVSLCMQYITSARTLQMLN